MISLGRVMGTLSFVVSPMRCIDHLLKTGDGNHVFFSGFPFELLYDEMHFESPS